MRRNQAAAMEGRASSPSGNGWCAMGATPVLHKLDCTANRFEANLQSDNALNKVRIESQPGPPRKVSIFVFFTPIISPTHRQISRGAFAGQNSRPVASSEAFGIFTGGA
jgi:hypothetical protein